MTDLYAKPTGPYIADLLATMEPGDTLLIADGVYTGIRSMIQPPTGVAGRADARITIKAENDGKVLIDGQGKQQRPVWLDYSKGNDYFEIVGINVCGGVDYCIDASSTGNIFRRVIAWGQAQGAEGEQTARINGYNGEVEDCAFFGGRYCLGANQMGNDAPGTPVTTFRRCFAMYVGAVESSPKASFIYWYNSDPVRYENCIGSWDCQAAPNSQGIFYCATADPYIHGDKQTELINCIAYLKKTQRAPAAISGISAQGNRRITIDNCAVVIDLENPASDLKAFDLRAASQTQSGSLDLYIKNSTGIGPASGIHSDWQRDNVQLGESVTEVYGDQSLWKNDGTRGACIDPAGFLPLPMNQRIYDASILAGLPPINVTEDLEAIFGNIGDQPNPEPPPIDPATEPSMTVVPRETTPGSTVVVSFSGSNDPTDWFGLYVKDAPDFEEYIDWLYTSGTQEPGGVIAEGSLSMPMPVAPGSYDIRFFGANSYNLFAKATVVVTDEPSTNPNPEPEPPPEAGMVKVYRLVPFWAYPEDLLPAEDQAFKKKK